MLWIRAALAGIVLIAVAAAAHKFSSFLAEKDLMIQERDQQILNLNAKVEGMRIDGERLKASNASLEQDLRRKIDEAAQARQEASTLRAGDATSDRRRDELERKLADRERIEQVDRLTHSRRAELVVKVVNRSAQCEIENFFQTDGQCRSGVWVANGAKPAASAASAAGTATTASGQGAANAPR
jgi:predicted RNase H-like nuclease (RuvC/YqgF family)